MRRSKKTSKLRVIGLCEGNSPGTGEFPAQRASNAENVSIWCRHHDTWINAQTVHHGSAYVILFVTRQNEPIHDDKKTVLTYRLRFSPRLFELFAMHKQNQAV